MSLVGQGDGGTAGVRGFVWPGDSGGTGERGWSLPHPDPALHKATSLVIHHPPCQALTTRPYPPTSPQTSTLCQHVKTDVPRALSQAPASIRATTPPPAP